GRHEVGWRTVAERCPTLDHGDGPRCATLARVGRGWCARVRKPTRTLVGLSASFCEDANRYADGTCVKKEADKDADTCRLPFGSGNGPSTETSASASRTAAVACR